MAEQYLLELARKWIVANAPEPSKCVKCGQPQPSTMCTADLRCPIDYQSHVYTFTITNDPDAEAKRLAAFGQAALSTQPQELEISKYGRPIIWIADFYYKTLPGTAVDHISNQCVFSSRHEAVRWAKFEMRFDIDWRKWKSGTEDYPYLKNYDAAVDENKGLNPTFIATFEETFGPESPLPGTLLKRVSVYRTEVSGKFDWYAKTAHGDWDTHMALPAPPAKPQPKE